jgi:DNA-binding XRE family transcriptional regulator
MCGTIASGYIGVKDNLSLAENSLQAVGQQHLAAVSFGAILTETTDASPTTIGRNIKARREELQMSQVELADRLGIRQPSLNKMERSKGWPSSETLVKLGVELQCSVDRFLQNIDSSYSKIVAGLRIPVSVTTPSPANAKTATKSLTGDQHNGRRSGHPRSVISLRAALTKQIDDAEKHASLAHTAALVARELAAKPGLFAEPAVSRGTASGRSRKNRNEGR